MFGRKKYRKGKRYMYMVCGTKRQPDYKMVSFISSGDVTLKKNLDACEMRDQIFAHVRNLQGIEDTDEGTYAYTFYHIESL